MEQTETELVMAIRVHRFRALTLLVSAPLTAGFALLWWGRDVIETRAPIAESIARHLFSLSETAVKLALALPRSTEGLLMLSAVLGTSTAYGVYHLGHKKAKTKRLREKRKEAVDGLLVDDIRKNRSK